VGVDVDSILHCCIDSTNLCVGRYKCSLSFQSSFFLFNFLLFWTQTINIEFLFSSSDQLGNDVCNSFHFSVVCMQLRCTFHFEDFLEWFNLCKTSKQVLFQDHNARKNKRERPKERKKERKKWLIVCVSISGHYSFHVFYGLTMLYTIVSLKRTPSQLFNYVNRKLLTRLLSGKLRYISRTDSLRLHQSKPTLLYQYQQRQYNM
jgi:hypothetical protein